MTLCGLARIVVQASSLLSPTSVKAYRDPKQFITEPLTAIVADVAEEQEKTSDKQYQINPETNASEYRFSGFFRSRAHTELPPQAPRDDT